MPTSLRVRLKLPLILSPFAASAIFSVVCNHGGCCVQYGASTAFLYVQLDAAGLPQFASAACHHPRSTVLILNEKHDLGRKKLLQERLGLQLHPLISSPWLEKTVLLYLILCPQRYLRYQFAKIKHIINQQDDSSKLRMRRDHFYFTYLLLIYWMALQLYT